MNTYHYVYTLQSLSHPSRLYTGHTVDLHQRLEYHNAGKVRHTAKFRPWTIRSATAFQERSRALAFERYLKTGSGPARSPAFPRSPSRARTGSCRSVLGDGQPFVREIAVQEVKEAASAQEGSTK